MSTKHSLANLAVRAEYDRSTHIVDLTKRPGPPATPEKVLEPGYWRDLSDVVHAGDIIIARYGPQVVDEVRLRVITTFPGGGVRVAPVGAEDEVDPLDAEPRNLLICLKSSKSRITWTLCERVKGRWTDIWAGSGTLEPIVRSVVTQFGHDVDPAIWPDLTIAPRGLDEIIEEAHRPIPAGRDDAYAAFGIGAWLDGSSVTLLCPIGRSDGQWSVAMGHDRRQGLHAVDHHLQRFMPRVLADKILMHFNDGSVTHMGQLPKWKEYGNGRQMLMVRPSWRLMNVCSGVFSHPSFEPIMTEEKKRKYREAEEHLEDVARVASHHESQGQVYNPDTRAWVPPSRED
jgi:hypothetical protein